MVTQEVMDNTGEIVKGQLETIYPTFWWEGESALMGYMSSANPHVSKAGDIADVVIKVRSMVQRETYQAVQVENRDGSYSTIGRDSLGRLYVSHLKRG